MFIELVLADSENRKILIDVDNISEIMGGDSVKIGRYQRKDITVKDSYDSIKEKLVKAKKMIETDSEEKPGTAKLQKEEIKSKINATNPEPKPGVWDMAMYGKKQ